jgi:hypothetical protein
MSMRGVTAPKKKEKKKRRHWRGRDGRRGEIPLMWRVLLE